MSKLILLQINRDVLATLIFPTRLLLIVRTRIKAERRIMAQEPQVKKVGLVLGWQRRPANIRPKSTIVEIR